MKILSCYGLAVAAAVGLAEAYLRAFPPPEKHYEGLQQYYVPDQDLGYAIAKGEREVTVSKRAGDSTLIYRVTYTIDANGMRHTRGSGARMAFFFGCSFTFGEGVDDDATLPQMFANTASGWRAVNFGVHGYGAHQVLRILETNRASQVEGAKPAAVVYTMLPDHAYRAAGRSPWENRGPHYEVIGGSIKYVGPYENNFPMPALLYRVASRSHLYRKLIDQSLRQHIWPRDRERLLQIILRARDVVEGRTQTRFVVLVWDLNTGDDGTAGWIASRLRAVGVDVVLVSEIAPELVDAAAYYIAGDGHPIGEAYGRVARQLAYHLN